MNTKCPKCGWATSILDPVDFVRYCDRPDCDWIEDDAEVPVFAGEHLRRAV